jgi:16S rRNA (guanine527-N7)-methyltransferase
VAHSPDPSLEALLLTGLTDLGLALTPAQSGRLLALAAELAEWNERFNLTAIRDPRDVVVKHLLDSLSVLPHLHGKAIADAGTGAGFPGLPLAIADPARRYTLIEATTKKAKFVQHVVERLGLTNATVVNARAEAFKPPHRFTTVVARALGSLAEFIRVAGHLCAPGGRLLAMKGRLPEEEIAAIPAAWRVLESPRLRVPGLEAERHLVVLQRAADVKSRSR